MPKVVQFGLGEGCAARRISIVAFVVNFFSHGAAEERSKCRNGSCNDADVDFEAAEVRMRG